MPQVLGLDAGGTKCDAVLMDERGAVKGWGRGGCAIWRYVGRESALAAVEAAIRGAFAGDPGPVDRVAGWVPGCGLDEMRGWFGPGFEPYRFLPEREPELGFAAALRSSGLLVVSGTGSFVHGRTEDGRVVHLGGDGPVVGDEGSAHHLGLLAIRAAFRSVHSHRLRSSLQAAVPTALQAASLAEVSRELGQGVYDRTGIAALARVLDREAEAGDRVAVGLLERGASELADVALAVIRELEMERVAAPLVASGGVAQGSRIFWRALCRRVLREAPNLEPVRPPVRPAVGACLLALRDLRVEWSEALGAAIRTSQRAHLARLARIDPAAPATDGW